MDDWKIPTNSVLPFRSSAIQLGATPDKVLTPKTPGARWHQSQGSSEELGLPVPRTRTSSLLCLSQEMRTVGRKFRGNPSIGGRTSSTENKPL